MTQLLILIGGIFRFPIIASNSSLEFLARFILFASILGMIPTLVAGIVNQTRIEAVTQEVFRLPRKPNMTTKAGLFVLTALFSANFMYFQESWVGEGCLITFFAILICKLGPYYGLQQGLGRIASQNLSQGFASIAGLGMVFAFVTSPIWSSCSPNQKLNVLVFIVELAALIPYLYAYANYKREGLGSTSVAFSVEKDLGLSFIKALKQLAATLPPSSLSLVDAVSLQSMSTPYQLALYGITQRVSALATFMTGANYLNDANKILNSPKLSIRNALRLFLKSTLLNAPFIILFLVASPYLVSFLSAGHIESDPKLIFAYLLVAMLQPAWVVSSNLVFTNSNHSQKLGSVIALFVIPISSALTVLGATVFGAAGVVYATTIGYFAAISVASWIYWRD